ncbi:hypothetical protein NGRA_1592 [Nosema granulosis]|uniref:Uncharacterized protein n=1 Tax=Nosema granulosis TaxID=83296 RepID=A0A9P6H0X3_9MICR|nr:hypothetical protein NGRA_1592 [Nosema granulosis]
MKDFLKFFTFSIIIYYLQMGLLVRIIKESIENNATCSGYYDSIQFISLYILIISIFEFQSFCKYCLLLQIEGMFQLIPLKVFRYLCLFTSLLTSHILIYRLLYLLLDIILFSYFYIIKDSTFANVFHRYNLRIGLDVKIRNAFIVSNV